MGEMADFELDRLMGEEELRFDFRHGVMDLSDACDLGIIDENGYEYE